MYGIINKDDVYHVYVVNPGKVDEKGNVVGRRVDKVGMAFDIEAAVDKWVLGYELIHGRTPNRDEVSVFDEWGHQVR